MYFTFVEIQIQKFMDRVGIKNQKAFGFALVMVWLSKNKPKSKAK